MKIETAHLQKTTHKVKFQKYNFIMEKTVTNIKTDDTDFKNSTTYEIISIEGVEKGSDKFETLSDIFIHELKN